MVKKDNNLKNSHKNNKETKADTVEKKDSQTHKNKTGKLNYI